MKKVAQNGYIAKIAVFFRNTFGHSQDVMPTAETTREQTQLDEFTLAENGARQRAERAKAALAIFHLEHGNPRTQMWAESFPHHDSLLREYHALSVEEDDACRLWAKAQSDLRDAKRAAGLITTLAQGVKNV